MKNILLIGDSIRMGYQPVVERLLAGKAAVSGPDDNCGPSRDIRAHLESWIRARHPDIIHLNCGLHDLRRESDGSFRVPPDGYRDNLEAIFAALGAGAARVVWATTTPVDEALHHQHKPFDRFERDVAEYNRIALGLAGRAGFAVDDLFAAMDPVKGKYLQRDGVHFTAEGYELLGGAVARCLEAHL